MEKFRSFVNDASVFVRYFGMAMAKSAPHVYLSALPFAPTRSGLCTLFQLISSNPTCRTWAIVSLAIIGDGDFKCRGRGPFHCTLTRWPAHHLRLGGRNNSCVERHDGRDSSRPIYRTHGSSLVRGTLARWPAYRLRLLRSNNSCVGRHYGRDGGRPIYWTQGFG